MVEENAQAEQPEGPAENSQGSKEKVSAGRRISLAFSDMYGIIKKPKKKDDQPLAETSKPGAEAKKPAMALPAIFSTQKINLKTVNQILVAVLVGLIAMMFYVTFRKGPTISSVTAAVSKIKFLEVKTKEITVFQQLSNYLDQINTRDIFSAFQEKKPPPPVEVVEEILPPPPPEKPKVPIEQKAKNYKLIGISWGSNPKAIIRDTSTQEVHFMSEGEMIKGTDLTIKSVFKEEVVIESEGEEMSML